MDPAQNQDNNQQSIPEETRPVFQTIEEVPSAQNPTNPTNLGQINPTPPQPNEQPLQTPPPQQPFQEPSILTPSGDQNPPPETTSKPKGKIIAAVIGVLVLVGGVAGGVALVNQQQLFQQKAAGVSPVACPIAADGTKTIVNFNGQFIRSDQAESSAQLGPVSTLVGAGSYKVTLVSYEKDHPKDSDDQPNESWFLKLNNSQGATFSQTNPISDLPLAENMKIEVVNSELSLTEDINSVIAYHAVYPDKSTTNSINPVCAVFEPLATEISARCTEIKAFDENWNQLTTSQLQNLSSGDSVRFSVGGSATEGQFDKAMFTINGVSEGETTLIRPGTDEYYVEYQIPEGILSFQVTAQIHHVGLNQWF